VTTEPSTGASSNAERELPTRCEVYADDQVRIFNDGTVYIGKEGEPGMTITTIEHLRRLLDV
jgi:hypothetical protein